MMPHYLAPALRLRQGITRGSPNPWVIVDRKLRVSRTAHESLGEIVQNFVIHGWRMWLDDEIAATYKLLRNRILASLYYLRQFRKHVRR